MYKLGAAVLIDAFYWAVHVCELQLLWTLPHNCEDRFNVAELGMCKAADGLSLDKSFGCGTVTWDVGCLDTEAHAGLDDSLGWARPPSSQVRHHRQNLCHRAASQTTIAASIPGWYTPLNQLAHVCRHSNSDDDVLAHEVVLTMQTFCL
jgi:hypothetical protein